MEEKGLCQENEGNESLDSNVFLRVKDYSSLRLTGEFLCTLPGTLKRRLRPNHYTLIILFLIWSLDNIKSLL